jgi:hypothetical protein
MFQHKRNRESGAVNQYVLPRVQNLGLNDIKQLKQFYSHSTKVVYCVPLIEQVTKILFATQKKLPLGNEGGAHPFLVTSLGLYLQRM